VLIGQKLVLGLPPVAWPGPEGAPAAADRLRGVFEAAGLGRGRIAALHCRSSTLYQNR
jgi:hypothetical protein